MYVIGFDPGPVTGVTLLKLDDYQLVGEPGTAQVNSEMLARFLHGLDGLPTLAVAVEQFVVGVRAGKSSQPQAGAAARYALVQIMEWAKAAYPTYLRAAAEVKPWATDERLIKAGLMRPTDGMRHARDAARHALFCAVHDFKQPDPLSGRFKRQK
jgi:hypothetical protein